MYCNLVAEPFVILLDIQHFVGKDGKERVVESHRYSNDYISGSTGSFHYHLLLEVLSCGTVRDRTNRSKDYYVSGLSTQ